MTKFIAAMQGKREAAPGGGGISGVGVVVTR